MAAKDLSELVRRRLWELARTVEEASQRSRRVLTTETIARIARTGGSSFISEGVAEYLARALDVPENRVRRAAGLPPVPDPRESITTRPNLRLLRNDEQPADQGNERTT
jgi:histone H3/H4